MPEYGFYFRDFALIREYSVQRKPVSRHILHSDMQSKEILQNVFAKNKGFGLPKRKLYVSKKSGENGFPGYIKFNP